VIIRAMPLVHFYFSFFSFFFASAGHVVVVFVVVAAADCSQYTRRLTSDRGGFAFRATGVGAAATTDSFDRNGSKTRDRSWSSTRLGTVVEANPTPVCLLPVGE